MTPEQLDNILLAWWFADNGDPIKDVFDSLDSSFDSLEDAFIALCEEHFGKDFITNWEP